MLPTKQMWKLLRFALLGVSPALSYAWNLGSMLGMCLVWQIVTGTMLMFYYRTENPFGRTQYIMYEVNYGWAVRIFHFNGASMFMFLIYCHILKALVYTSYKLAKVWWSGILILLLVMAEAFIGYVLLWRQISFWAAVVITSLLTVVPYVGYSVVLWVWGGYNVNLNTLKFFLVLHFLIPYLLLLLVIAHLVFLHETGSSNELEIIERYNKVTFYPYYVIKDLMNVPVFLGFAALMLLYPFRLGECEMFEEANEIVSPLHIVPEWYFLFAYAILRAVPNKRMGVVCILASILVLAILPLFTYIFPVSEVINRSLVSLFVIVCVILSWLGQCPVEYPFVGLSLVFTILYFVLVILICSLWVVTNFLHYPAIEEQREWPEPRSPQQEVKKEALVTTHSMKEAYKSLPLL